MEFWKILLLLVAAVTTLFLVQWTQMIVKMARLGWLKEFLRPQALLDIQTYRNMYFVGVVSVAALLFVSFAYSENPFWPLNFSSLPLIVSALSLVGCLFSIMFSFESSKFKEWCQYYEDMIATPGYEDIKDLYARAYGLVSAGLYSKARPLLEDCIARAPIFTPAHKELALVLGKVGDDNGVILHRRAVKQLDPADTVNRFNLANTLGRIGRIEEAIQEAEDLLKIKDLKSYDEPALQNTKKLLEELKRGGATENGI